MKRIAVVALGGNALLRGDEMGTISDQAKNTYNTCKFITKLLTRFESLVITHGNGPQVGNILLRNEAGFRDYNIPKMPLDICVADSQGGIGYLTERQMRNVILEESLNREVLTLVTQVLVDREDPAFSNPTKPVGPFYTESEVAKLKQQQPTWQFKEDPKKRGWRRVVPSPKPIQIMGEQIIEELANRGVLVIAAGGGGIPVIKGADGILDGVEAVIDKDSASSLLATRIHAHELFILTDIKQVAINFKKPGERFIDKMTADEALEYYNNGEFEAGSMGPKVMAAIRFIQNGGERTTITDATSLENFDGGTQITK